MASFGLVEHPGSVIFLDPSPFQLGMRVVAQVGGDGERRRREEAVLRCGTEPTADMAKGAGHDQAQWSLVCKRHSAICSLVRSDMATPVIHASPILGTCAKTTLQALLCCLD